MDRAACYLRELNVLKYLYQPDKKVLKQGAVMTDEAGNVVYEAQMLKNPLIGAMEFSFINHVSGKTIPHKVSKTVTTGTTTGGLTDFFSTNSRFKLDGTNIWDYLHEKGIRIDSNFSGNKLGMTYHVTQHGREMATLATSTPKGKSFITSGNVYDVITEEQDLDMAFLVTFAIARTGQAFYN